MARLTKIYINPYICFLNFFTHTYTHLLIRVYMLLILYTCFLCDNMMYKIISEILFDTKLGQIYYNKEKYKIFDQIYYKI